LQNGTLNTIFSVAMTRFMHTVRGHGPCSRDTKSGIVNTGRKHGRKIWSPVFTGRVRWPWTRTVDTARVNRPLWPYFINIFISSQGQPQTQLKL